MSAIYDPPQPTNAGLEFDYSVWTPNTVATFTNVPWNSDYRDVPIFPNGKAGLDKYIDDRMSTNITIRDLSYARPGNPIRISLPLNRMMRFNYVRVENPAQPVPGGDVPRSWYYFITDVRHISPNTTEMYVQLDVMQSWVYDITMGRCYIETGHIGIANENQMDEYGRSFLTVPEGFDLGNEYQIDEIFNRGIGSVTSSGLRGYKIIALSTVDILADPGTVSNPRLETSEGSVSQGLPNGGTLYLLTDPLAFFSAMKTTPWKSQGIIGLWAFPDAYDIPLEGETRYGARKISGGRAPIQTRTVNTKAENWRNRTWPIRLSRYRHLKKFLTYPYSFFELTCNNGAPLIIKPESWQNDNCEVVEIPHWTPPNIRVMFMPKGYNTGVDKGFERNGLPTGGEFLDFMTGITDFPSFSIVNDGYLSVMASQARSIAFQHQNADWSQQRAMAGNELAYQQATQSMELSRQQTRLGVSTANQQTALANNTAIQRRGVDVAESIAGGLIGGARAGGAIGAVAGGAAGVAQSIAGVAGTAIDINARNQSTAISNSQAMQANALNVGNTAYMRDSNRQYADFAAQGDYRNSIAAINAKVQDAKLTQPTTSGQLGGDAFNLAAWEWGYLLKFKMVTTAVMRMIGEHWLRYGYAINRYFNVGKRFHVMSNFTYWKMLECTIIDGAMPELFKQAIRGIFEKGVTVWKNPDDIGVIDPGNNNPESGVRLT